MIRMEELDGKVYYWDTETLEVWVLKDEEDLKNV